jgi:Ras family protein T1
MLRCLAAGAVSRSAAACSLCWKIPLLLLLLLLPAPQDGALNNEELNNFQYQCFGQPLTPDELASVRQMVAERMADGLNDAGAFVILRV